MAYNIIDTIDLNILFPNGKVTLIGISDLKEALENAKKDEFENDDRIRVVYDVDNDDIKILKILQRLVNYEVDITNCFILITTGNKNISNNLEKLVSQIDGTQFDYEIVDKEFHIVNEQPGERYTYADSTPIKINVDQLTKREEFLLTQSKTFCMYPWVHLHAYPTGDAYPCCHAEMPEKLGNCQQQSMEEIWSSDKMIKLRDDMLNERENSACLRCYEQEKSGFFSGRRSANKHHGHNIKKGVELNPPFELTYWDIRFSNLCNLSCRSCGHIFSSSWYQDQVELAGPEWAREHKPLFWAGRHKTDMIDQLLEHLPYVEQIYFAGGEPLMMDEHYQILEELERRKMFNVRLIYNTNFTKTKLKDRYVFDYWRKFDSVSVGASLDAMGTRAELIRKGTDWAEVERNRQMMMEQCPNVDFYVSATLSIQNALHIPDFHQDWVERGFIKPGDFNINILQDPAHLRIDIAPESYKAKIRARYQNHLEWLKSKDHLGRASLGFESALNFLETDNSKLLPKFCEHMNKLDELRTENILDVIPELNELTK